MTNTTTKTEYTQKEMNLFIEELYYKIARITEGGHYFDNYVYTIKQSEKEHRKTWGQFRNCLTVDKATKYFAVKYIIEAKYSKPDIKDYLHLKKELFTGYALYKEYQSKLTKIINKKVIAQLDEYDYPSYMNESK